jgi:hypothetical protein
MKREWVISIRKQCRMQGVPFFFKQWGGVRKKNNGRLLDGRTYDEYPERRAASMPDKSRCIAIAEGFLETFRSKSLQNSLVQVLT